MSVSVCTLLEIWLLTLDDKYRVYLNPQEAVPVGDADDSSTFETEHTPSSKGDNSTDLSWSSSPVSFHLVTTRPKLSPSEVSIKL